MIRPNRWHDAGEAREPDAGPDGELTHRVYRPDDETAIIDLLNHVFRRHRTLEWWRWAYEGNPHGRIDASLTFAGPTLVGQTAAVPLLYVHDGSPLRAARLQDGLVHPEFRGRGVFTRTFRSLTERVRDAGMHFVVGFPNDNSYPAFAGRFGYVHLVDIPTHYLPASRVPRVFPQDGRFEIDRRPRFTPGDSALIDAVLSRHRVHAHRTVEYLSWRYHQSSGYRYAVLRAYEGADQVGVVVFKMYEPARSIDLLEFVFSSSHPGLPTGSLASILHYLSEETPQGFNVWSMEHYPSYRALREAGFEPTGSTTHVIVASLSDACSSAWGSSDAYYFSMGDSDVF
jgi:GNAT superfamily N-acetyltransferase